MKVSTALFSKWYCSKPCEVQELVDELEILNWDRKDTELVKEVRRSIWRRYNKEDFEQVLKEMSNT